VNRVLQPTRGQTGEPERRILRLTSCAAFLLLGPVSGALAVELDETKLPPAAAQKTDFVRDIKPILENHCLKCHSDEKPRSHFHLTSREAALKGGEDGVDIIPGQSAKSPLIWYVARLDEEIVMPPEGRGTPLDAKEIGLLRAWIDQGVAWAPTLQEPTTQLTVAPTVGGTAVRGDAKKFRELYWQRDGWNGGLEEFEMVEKPTADSKITAAGHVLQDDYKISLSAEKNDLGFARFGWSQFRKYYDDRGGYYPLFPTPVFSLNRDVHLDEGRAWTEFGLTLPRWPKIIFGYEYQYREGSQSTLQWGPVINGTQIRDIYPAFENISEKVHILKLDMDYEVAGIYLSDNFRGEWYELKTQQFNDSSFSIGSTAMALTTARNQERYFQGANTFHLEKQLTDWWFASGGYLYSRLNGNAAADVQTLNPALLDPSFVAPGWNSQSIQLERESHVFSVSSLLGQWEGLSLSLATQNEWTRQTGLTIANVNLALAFAPFLFPLDQPESLHSDLDRSIFSQDLGLRFTKIPFTTLFADARFQQDTVGQYEQEMDGLTPFLRDTDMKGDLKDFRLGFNSSPLRRLSLSAHYRRYDKETDYDTRLKEPLGLEGYPAFIRWRDLLSNEAQTKLSFQLASWLQTSLTYQWIKNHYRTATYGVDNPIGNIPGGFSPGGGLLAGTYDSQVTSLNLTAIPWQRLFVSSTFAFQHARTLTSANDTTSVAPYRGNIYTAMLNGSFALNEKTDLVAGYSFSTADFAQDNFTGGLPLGTHYHQHGLEAGVKRQIGKGKTLGLQYRYYRYEDSSTGGASDFEAQALFATLAWRLP
jgi:hypothetical protein